MGKDKHKRFNEMNTFKNVYQNFDFKTPELQDYRSEIVELKGVWSKEHFKNENFERGLTIRSESGLILLADSYSADIQYRRMLMNQ